ncbi:Dihydroorotate dehydrogenase [Cohnella sp. OV330]|nr:Dihydroorotate dehydrogenase [Cohnella sp. OV330]
MPDWSYQTLFRPLLFRLPARTARGITLNAFGAVGRMPGGAFLIKTLGHQEPSALLETGWSATPVGLSGTIDPLGTAQRGLARLGFGFVEIGPVTVQPIESREPIELDTKQELIRFPEPFENEGLPAVIQKLANAGHSLPKYIRIAPMPGASDDEMVSQLIHLVDRLTAVGVAGIYVDTTSFNWDSPVCFRLLNRMTDCVKIEGSLFLYLPPDLSEDRLRLLLQHLDCSAWDGVVVGGEQLAEGGAAVQGLCVKSSGLETLRLVRRLGPSTWIVKVAAGVHEPQDATLFLQNGADAVLLGSGFVFAGPGLPKRVNDAIINDKVRSIAEPETPSFWRHWGWMCLLGIGMIVGGFMAGLIAISSVLLPYDLSFLHMKREELIAFNGHLIHFMSHDRITLSGTMISIGILYYQLAKHGLRDGLHWAKTAVTASCMVGFPSFFLYLGYGFFDPVHAAAAIILLPLFLLSLRRNPDQPFRGSVSRVNDRIWKRAMWGQLCFVVLGVSLAVGGLTIAAIGVTHVFVPTDLTFMGVTPEELDAFNPRLIPLIAHDRAGFGGALFSDAVVLLITALWGIQSGERWLWRTLLFGGMPAFFAALSVHYGIGYIDFIHLLPAWFAFALYVVGLILLYPYMHGMDRGASASREAQAST